MLRPLAPWICKKTNKNALSSGYQDLMGHLILTARPWSVLPWITLVCIFIHKKDIYKMEQNNECLISGYTILIKTPGLITRKGYSLVSSYFIEICNYISQNRWYVYKIVVRHHVSVRDLAPILMTFTLWQFFFYQYHYILQVKMSPIFMTETIGA